MHRERRQQTLIRLCRFISISISGMGTVNAPLAGPGVHEMNLQTSSFPDGSVMVDVLTMGWSTPSISTQFPAGTLFNSI